ncbi:MAG TPA: precorrin-8X methylmutase [Candidatus Dormibacteraeota bacterium]|nr:precorrin-8X methylmutase [Candidatus Dormibacteraeota bacterium]
MHARELRRWPVPGGLLDRLGMPPEAIEARSRRAARQLVGDRWPEAEAELAASLVYASGDPGLVDDIRFGGDPVANARAALDGGAAVLVDVTMVGAGVRLPRGRRLAVAIGLPGAAETARRCGTTRAAAGIMTGWDDFGAGGVVAVGNAPTALLAALDLADGCGPPACVIATCPGFSLAAEAKQALISSGLPHVVVAGTRGGSGLATAALNFLLQPLPPCGGGGPPRGRRGGL